MDDNQSVIDALKQPAQFRKKQFFPERPEGVISNWINSQGDQVKAALEHLIKNQFKKYVDKP